MTQKSRRKLRVWQELKRRGVPRVMAMYAATAFIVIEASDIIFPRLGLPDWSVTLMIILLIVGFPVAFVLSWIFDITPRGVVKTGALEDQDIPKESGGPLRRKLRTSDVVIALLLIVVIILAYPKIFGENESRLGSWVNRPAQPGDHPLRSIVLLQELEGAFGFSFLAKQCVGEPLVNK